VALAVGRHWPAADPADRAGRTAANGDRARARLGGHQQVARSDTGTQKLPPREREDAVRPFGRRTRRRGVGQVRTSAAAESARDEPDALDADVASAWKSGVRELPSPAHVVERVDLPAELVGRHELATERAEAERRNRDPAFDLRPVLDQRLGSAAAVDRVQPELSGDARGDEQT
jgi:hypothetical protein